MVSEGETKVKSVSVMPPGPGRACTRRKDSIPPERHDGPPCHVVRSSGACWCDACGGECGPLRHRRH